jgi:hypothetical protein
MDKAASRSVKDTLSYRAFYLASTSLYDEIVRHFVDARRLANGSTRDVHFLQVDNIIYNAYMYCLLFTFVQDIYVFKRS